MAFNQIYVNKELWPRVILKRLSLSMTHPYHCNKCPQRFHKIYEATAHYLSYHQNSNDLPEEEIRHKPKMHIATVHDGKKPYACTNCDVSFSHRLPQ